VITSQLLQLQPTFWYYYRTARPEPRQLSI